MKVSQPTFNTVLILVLALLLIFHMVASHLGC